MAARTAQGSDQTPGSPALTKDSALMQAAGRWAAGRQLGRSTCKPSLCSPAEHSMARRSTAPAALCAAATADACAEGRATRLHALPARSGRAEVRTDRQQRTDSESAYIGVATPTDQDLRALLRKTIAGLMKLLAGCGLAMEAAQGRWPDLSPGKDCPPDSWRPGSALANERAPCMAAGQVVLKLMTSRRDGTTNVVLSLLARHRRTGWRRRPRIMLEALSAVLLLTLHDAQPHLLSLPLTILRIDDPALRIGCSHRRCRRRCRRRNLGARCSL